MFLCKCKQPFNEPQQAFINTDRNLYKNEPDGIYQGELKNSQKYGLGAFLWNNGNFYYGNWKHNQMEGYGILLYSNGGILQGYFKSNKLHGLGKSVYPNGDFYIGNWQNGMFHGKGAYTIKKENRQQAGEFRNGNLIRYSKNKINFSLDFENSGILQIISEDTFYVGNCDANNVPDGLGAFCYKDRKFDAGVYKDGMLNGYGKAHFSNGDLYEGYFIQGKMHGIGLYFVAKTKENILGNFNNNMLIKKIKVFDNNTLTEPLCLSIFFNNISKGKIMKDSGEIPKTGEIEDEQPIPH